MTESCCPQLKQLQAKFVTYAPNNNNECCCTTRQAAPKSTVPNVSSLSHAVKETDQFQTRVTKLKGKLDEATANIALLRSWVGETGETIREKPKTPEEMIDDIKALIIELDEFEHQATVITERGMEVAEALETIEGQYCYCAMESESCEAIKKELNDIAEEKENLEDDFTELQRGPSEGFSPGTLEAVRKEISEVKACTAWNCPTFNPTKPPPTSSMDTGIQSNCCVAPKRPKISQTDSNPKWNQGTDPCCQNSCSKALNTGKWRR